MDELVAKVMDAARKLSDWRKAVLTDKASGLDIMGRHPNQIDAMGWPNFHDLLTTHQQWSEARSQAEGAWNAMPLETRAAMRQQH